MVPSRFLSSTVTGTSCLSRSDKKAPDRQLQKFSPTRRMFSKLTRGPWCEESILVSTSISSAAARCINMQRSLMLLQLPCMWFWLAQNVRFWCQALISEHPHCKGAAVSPAHLGPHQGMVLSCSAMKKRQAETPDVKAKPLIVTPLRISSHSRVRMV